jgi:hypothetical protein
MKPLQDTFSITLPQLKGVSGLDPHRLLSLEQVYGGIPQSKDFYNRARGVRVLEVYPRTRVTYRNAVQAHATFFRREFGYDFVQYHANDHDKNCRIFMWAGRDYPEYAFGSVCFRFRPYKTSEGEVTAGWEMAWIWLHPYCRGQGWLKNLWPYLLRRFGSFYVSPPHSKAMKQYLLGAGDPWLSPQKLPGLDPGGFECVLNRHAYTLVEQAEMGVLRSAESCPRCPRPICPSTGSHVVECRCSDCTQVYSEVASSVRALE